MLQNGTGALRRGAPGSEGCWVTTSVCPVGSGRRRPAAFVQSCRGERQPVPPTCISRHPGSQGSHRGEEPGGSGASVMH